MEILIIAIIIMLSGSAFFSATEAAIFTIPLNKAKILANQKKKGGDYLLRIKKDIRSTIIVLVIFTNIFNIAGSILVGAVATEVLGSAKLGIFSALFTFLVIIFAEIIPKSLGDTFATPISLKIAKPLFYVTKALFPLVYVIGFITNPLPKKRKTVSEEEIRSLSHIGYLEGVIEKDEKEMISRVFLLNDLTARQIMTPRTMITAFEESKKLKELEEEIYSLSHSRIPTYKENLDNITGICHQRDLLIALCKNDKDRSVSDLANQEITFVPEEKKIDDLIPVFREQRCHLAIVTDEFGGTSGVVTLEDVLEQIVGSIVDETDRTTDLRKEAKERKEKS